jgi:membrane protein involved in colicin uptake
MALLPLLLKLLGFGRSALAGLFDWARRNPAWAVAAGALFVAWLTAAHADHWKAEATKQRTLVIKKNKQIDDMKAASDANLKAALAQKAAAEQRYKERANEADNHDAVLAADYDRRLAAYRATHRVFAPGADGCAAPAAPGSGGAQGGNGPGQGAELVAVTADDLKILVENTRRLLVVHDWAVKLNAAAPDAGTTKIAQ